MARLIPRYKDASLRKRRLVNLRQRVGTVGHKVAAWTTANSSALRAEMSLAR